MRDIEKEIQEQLDAIETVCNVRILLAVESGSRAWGFASPDSDYDVRFLYVRNIEEYLRIDAEKDVIEWKLDEVLEEFDRIVGLDRLRAIHLNDSQNPMGSHKDRHARIGEGTIGLDALVRVLNHPSLCRLPFYLETPCDDAGHGEEIRRLKEALHGI